MTYSTVNQKRFYNDRLSILLIFFLLPIFHALKSTDILCFYCILHLFWGVLTKERSTDKQTKRIQLFFYIFLGYIVILLPYGYTTNASYVRILQFLGCILSFSYGATIELDSSKTRFILQIGNILSFLLISYWALFSRSFFNFTVFHLNPNGTGLIGLMLFYTAFMFGAKKSVISLLIPAFIILISTSRSDLIAVLYLIFIYMFLVVSAHMKYNPKSVLAFLFFFTIIVISIITFIYPLLSTSDYAMDLTLFSQKYFNKNMFSGRQIIWSELIHFIKLKPLFGYGLATTPTHLFDTDFSSHNLYLQTGIQCGFTGLFLLSVLFGSFFIHCDLPNKHYSVRFYSIFLSFLLQQCFEVSLTQNVLPISLIFWLIIGIGFNYSLQQDDNTLQLHEPRNELV